MGDLQLSLGSPSRSLSIFFFPFAWGRNVAAGRRGESHQCHPSTRSPPSPSVPTHLHPLPSQARHHGGSQPQQLTGTSSMAGALASPRAVPGNAPTTTFLVFSLFFFWHLPLFLPFPVFCQKLILQPRAAKCLHFPRQTGDSKQ